MSVMPDWKTMKVVDRIDAVKALMLQGLSASQAASHFTNCTRNSIISLCHRKGIRMAKNPGPDKATLQENFAKMADKGRAAQGHKPKAHGNNRQPKVNAIVARVAAKRKEPAFETAPLPEEELGNDAAHLLGIMDLTNNTCRWMHGDPKGPHGYCGKQTKAGSSWCRDHHARVFPGGRS